MPTEEDHAAPRTLPLSLLVCMAATVAAVGGARYWETATGLSYWAWLAVGAAVTATAVPFAAVVFGYRAAETALNRRDAALAAKRGSR